MAGLLLAIGNGTASQFMAGTSPAAVQPFFRGSPWTDNDRTVWETMTGRSESTATTLCDFAREVLSDERMRSQGLPRPPPPLEELR